MYECAAHVMNLFDRKVGCCSLRSGLLLTCEGVVQGTPDVLAEGHVQEGVYEAVREAKIDHNGTNHLQELFILFSPELEIHEENHEGPPTEEESRSDDTNGDGNTLSYPEKMIPKLTPLISRIKWHLSPS